MAKKGRPVSWPTPNTPLSKRLQDVLPKIGMAKISLKYFDGVAKETAGRYLSGEQEPPPSALKRISEIESCDLNWLAWGDDFASPPAEAGGNKKFDNIDRDLVTGIRAMWALISTLNHVQIQAVEGRQPHETFLKLVRDLIVVVEDYEVDLLEYPEQSSSNAS